MANPRLKFSLQIPNRDGYFTFFSLPQTNSYQKISAVSYLKDAFLKTEDKFYKNNLIVLKDPSLQIVEFDAVLKSVKTPLVAKSLKYSTKAKKLIVSDEFVNGKDPQIKEIAKKVDGKTPAEIIKNSYELIINMLDYGYPFRGLYPYSQALRDRVTDSGGFSTLLASILNSNGIPTRLVSGFLLKEDRSTSLLSKLPVKALSFDNLETHIWLEAMLPNGRWFVMDPTIDLRRRKGSTKREGGLGVVGADRIVMSFGHNLSAQNLKLQIVNYPISIRV